MNNVSATMSGEIIVLFKASLIEFKYSAVERDFSATFYSHIRTVKHRARKEDVY